MKKHDFEARREALLKDIREVMDDEIGRAHV